MNDIDNKAFDSLFKEAFMKCFGQPLKTSLTESESKLFSNEILEATGLVIGWKSIKNYSFFLLNPSTEKQENPSTATLDTLARFVLNVPKTDETLRKKNEAHYPYWYTYKEPFIIPESKEIRKKPISTVLGLIAALSLVVLLFFSFPQFIATRSENFTDDFTTISETTLQSKGWKVQSIDTTYWEKNNEKPGHLTLYTLKGDNWPDSIHQGEIKNLLLKKIESECFVVETHLTAFIPRKNWQQAGIILLEDSNFKGKSIRVSLAYNDYTGGYPKAREILIQTITSLGNTHNKPEEIAHLPLFKPDSDKADSIVSQNLHHFAFRIEKEQNKFRFLYATGAMKNSAFKEIVSHEFKMTPSYVGLFAIKGFVEGKDNIIPAYIDYFSMSGNACKNE